MIKYFVISTYCHNSVIPRCYGRILLLGILEPFPYCMLILNAPIHNTLAVKLNIKNINTNTPFWTYNSLPLLHKHFVTLALNSSGANAIYVMYILFIQRIK